MGEAPDGRRAFLARAGVFAGLLLLGGLGGCGKAEGPEPIRHDRETCEMCNMIISDPRFAAQIRDPDGRMHKFDDIGDAVHWLARQPWHKRGVAPKEFWVKSHLDGETWLDARQAHYRAGLHTPMEYGFGAERKPAPGTVNYAAMARAVLRMGLHARCETPAAPGHEDHAARSRHEEEAAQ